MRGLSVHRRIGGLEILRVLFRIALVVHRRIGGLEISPTTQEQEG